MDLVKDILRPLNFLYWTMFLAIVSFNQYWLIASAIISITLIIRYSQSSEALPTLSVKRFSTNHRYKETDQIKNKMIIKNTGDNSFRGELIDEVPAGCRIWSGSNVVLVILEPGDEIEINYDFSFSTRGEYILGPVIFRHHSVGEFHQYIDTIENYFQLFIIPSVDKVSSYRLQPSFLKLIGGAFPSKLTGDGYSFSGIREYAVGDTYRRINWKQSARYRTLYSNIFDIDRTGNFTMIIDLTEEEEPIADSSVRAALGLAHFLMNYRCRVGMVIISEYVYHIPQKYGKRHLIEMTELLTKTSSSNIIKNMDLFKVRVHEGIQKIKGEKNEILLFSSLFDVEKALFIAQEVGSRGNLTILAPSFSTNFDAKDPLYLFTKQLMMLRNDVIRNYMLSNKVKIYEWIPDLPFDNSVSQWRNR